MGLVKRKMRLRMLMLGQKKKLMQGPIQKLMQRLRLRMMEVGQRVRQGLQRMEEGKPEQREQEQELLAHPPCPFSSWKS
jgi:predicted nucleotide-binding protein (sugar kinase/HSP70/actin superfamily)